jgi:hypothetical protein
MKPAFIVEWAPAFAWEFIAVLALAAAVLVGIAVYRRARGAWWRALAFTLLILALANPSLVKEQRQPLDDIALVVIDESASQEIEPRPAQSEAALRHVLEALKGLDATEVRVVRAGAGIGEDGTRLFSGLRDALAKVPRKRVAGVVVISDGQIHDAPDNLEAFGLNAPLHLLLTGEEDERDRRLVVKNAPSFGIVGRPQTMTITVEDLPRSSVALARVTIRRDGTQAEEILVPVGVEQEIIFSLDHRGPSVFEIEVEAGPQELTLANNRAAVVVNGVRDRLRVLLVSGEPHAGERAWRNILKSDPSVDLVHFTILRPPEKQDGTPIRELSLIAFPTRELFEVKLDEFDLIIFDRYRRRGVLPSIYLDNIAKFVDGGGALLEAVGPSFATPLSLYRTPLGRVLPGEPTGTIFEQGFRPQVTDLGTRHPVTSELTGAGDPNQEGGGTPTWGRWFRQLDTDVRRGQVVMSGVQGRPLLILDRVGKGRVAQLTSDHMWLWSRGFEGGGPQAELLRRISHWLMREPDLEEETLRATVASGRLDITRRSLDLEPRSVEVTAPSGEVTEVPLKPGRGGRASASIVAEEMGLYRISDGTRTTLAAAGPINPREFEDARSSADILKPLIEESGGTAVRLAGGDLPKIRKVSGTRDRFGRGWVGLVENREYVVTGVEQTPLLPAFAVLILVLGASLFAWFREGR